MDEDIHVIERDIDQIEVHVRHDISRLSLKREFVGVISICKGQERQPPTKVINYSRQPFSHAPTIYVHN